MTGYGTTAARAGLSQSEEKAYYCSVPRPRNVAAEVKEEKEEKSSDTDGAV